MVWQRSPVSFGTLFAIALLAAAAAQAAQCEFVTKNGEQCKREAEGGGRYCGKHAHIADPGNKPDKPDKANKQEKPDRPAKRDKTDATDNSKKQDPAKSQLPVALPKDEPRALPPDSSAKKDDGKWRKVLRVIDGENVVLEGEEKVRLLGVDAPEKLDGPRLDEEAKAAGRDKDVFRELGARAACFVRDLLEGKKVTVETDEKKQDADGRMLAFLRFEDGMVANAEIVKAGFASVRGDAQFRGKDDYARFEADAKAARRGLWGAAGVVRRADVKLADGQTFEKAFAEETKAGAWVSVQGKRYWYPKASIASIVYTDPAPEPPKPAEEKKDGAERDRGPDKPEE